MFYWPIFDAPDAHLTGIASKIIQLSSSTFASISKGSVSFEDSRICGGGGGAGALQLIIRTANGLLLSMPARNPCLSYKGRPPHLRGSCLLTIQRK